MLLGGLMWWRQSRLEAALLSQEDRVLLAVRAEPSDLITPAVLPESPAQVQRIALPTITAAPSPTVDPASLVANEPTPAVTLEPQPTPTENPFPPAEAIPSHIIAPQIGLDASVIEMGWQVLTDASGTQYSEWMVPSGAAGWHKNSMLPGHGGNTVLSGHHNVDGEIFRYVADLEPGNEIMLEAGGHTYRYQVQEKYILKERGEPIEVRRANNKYIEPTPDERLTLVTCWPYETNTHRVVVIARPIVAVPLAPAGVGE